MGARGGSLPVAVHAIDKVRQTVEGFRETAFGMHTDGKAAGRDELIHKAAHVFEHPGIAPKLGRAASAEGTAETIGFIAGHPVVFPKHVHGTDEPVFMRGVHGDGAGMGGGEGQNSRAEQ